MADDAPSFIMKAYDVHVRGFPAHRVYAASPGKARAKSWQEYGAVSDGSFADFLKISSVGRAVTPEHFGAQITVNGTPGFYISSNSQYIQFVYPDADVILNAHPLDVEPESFRPDAYRGAA